MLAHRGPDGVGSAAVGRSAVAHTRLAIVDVAGGQQPMRSDDQRVLLVCNGEVYNHLAIRGRLLGTHDFKTKSDSEVVLHLYQDLGARCVAELDGMFAFFVTDGDRFMAARDPFGIKPLYFGHGRERQIWFASEFKALIGHCESFAALPPGSSMTESGVMKRWFLPDWAERMGTRRELARRELLDRLEESVVKRLMSDVPMGVFLSGGLDSSIVAAAAQPYLDRPMSFAVGLEDAPDLEAARFVADALGFDHYECTYSLEDVHRELWRIIYHLESYDAALIQSAVPCYFLSKLAAEHVKVVLTGEGADELFAGYSYFENIRDPATLHRECARLLLGLHAMNLQRVDRMTMAHGLEGRVPFLDVAFVELAMSLDPELKLHGSGLEKRVLREAVSDLLPPEIVERPKLEFAYGSGADHLLRFYADSRITDRELSGAERRFPHDPPSSKEELLYRIIFSELFPDQAASRAVERWKPPGTRTAVPAPWSA
jgi:asparagine synthase (glutamine-hydrolysing)